MTDRVDGYQRRTSILVVASSISTALALFAIFRFTAEMLSVKWIGAWSLVQGLFLVARISDSGAGSNVSRVIAVRIKDGTDIDLRNFTAASLIIAAAPSTLLTLLTAPAIGLYVTKQFGGELDVAQLWIIVWLALLNSVLAAAANICMAVCEGMFLLNLRSGAVIAGNVLGLLALLPLLSHLGPAGVGWTYCIIAGTQFAVSAGYLVTAARHQPPLHRRSVQQHIRSLWRENLHLSSIALIRLSFEPVTKFLLSLFAPLGIIAQFELALRVTTQIRIIVQSAIQPLLVIGARSGSGDTGAMQRTFLHNDRVLSILSLGLMLAQIVAAPTIQWLGMGVQQREFLVFFALLSVGNAINTMGISGYYWQLASGALTPLVRIQALMALTNLGLGVLGRLLGSPTLVTAAYSAAFMLGGLASRSFLRDLPRAALLLPTFLVMSGGAAGTAFILSVTPAPLSRMLLLLLLAAVVAVVCMFLSYRISRRTS